MGSPGTVIAAASGSTPPGVDPSGAAAGRARRGLAHEPALDGLRGAALLGIVFFHLERFPGGFLTVDLFFALSGFLITSLLLAEAERNGSVGLGAFWARRARRLLPALWVTLVGVSILLLVYTPEGERAAFRDDALATLFYVFNWNRLTESAAYWDLFTQPSPLEHMWTLAMEEQFYLFWPLATIGLLRWGRRRHERRVAATAPAPAGNGNGDGGNGAEPPEPRPRSNGKATNAVDPAGLDLGPLRGAALALVVVAVAWMALAYEPGDTNFAYFSTVTRMAPMLLGALLASFTVRQRRRTGPPRPEVEIMAVAAVFVMVVLLASANGQAAMYYQGGMAVFSLCSCVVIWAVTGGPLGLVGKVLSVRPLQWFGRVSYGVYLWHWPVIVFMTPDRLGLDRWATDVARLATTLVVAAISYRFLEQPLRRGALPGGKAWAATFFAILATLGFLLVATKGEPLSVTLEETEDLADQLAAGAAEDPRDQGADNPIAYYPAPDDVPDGAVKVLLVGDSGAAAWGPELAEVAESGQRRDDPPMSVAWSTQYLCSPVNGDGPTLTPDGDVLVEEPCHDLRRRIWREVIDAYDPDVVVYLLANAGFTQEHLVGDRWVPECHPVYDGWLEETLVEEAELLTANGADFVFATSPYTATLLPGTAEVVDCRNATYGRAAALVPGSRIVDLNRWASEQGHGGLFKDSVHFSEAGARRASRWLLPILQSWYPNGCPGSAAAIEDEPADPADRPRCTAQPGGEAGGADGDGEP